VRDPRVLAGLAYAVPLVPAVWILHRERHNRFLRLHAAQSLAFFLALALAQSALFAALVAVGGIVSSLGLAAVLGLVFLALFLVVGMTGLLVWLRLLAGAMSGRLTYLPVLSSLALRLEATVTRLQRLIPARPV
jgi:uncharacterized membrane protein